MSDALTLAPPPVTAASLVKLAPDFQAELLALMPTGLAWPTDPASLQSHLAGAWSQTLARLNARAVNLLFDAFPSTTVELLPEWESALGLPDPCAGESPTVSQRQMQVVARFASSGGQSPAYFIDFAALLGVSITVSQDAPARFGVATFGQPMNNDQWAFVWVVSVSSLTIYSSKFGSARFGDPFASWGNAVLECEINRIKPAHTIVQFQYSGSADLNEGIGEFAIGSSRIGGS